MAQPTKSRNKAVATKAASAHGHGHAATHQSPPSPGLHYSREDLHADYQQTFRMFMRMLAIGILGALAYFFVMIIYLGAFGHTPTDDYVREFGTRIQYEYKGMHMPEYDDPSILPAPKPAKEAR